MAALAPLGHETWRGKTGVSLCLIVGGQALAIAATGFTLGWTHTVERIDWFERWQVVPEGLLVVEARVSGAGAGMEAPAGAVRTANGWTYAPDLPARGELVLAASGARGEGWEFCAAGTCRTLGAAPGDPIVIRPAGAADCPP